MRIEFKVEGLRELERALLELPRTTAKGVMRRVGIKALTPMRDEARALAPDDPATSPPYDLKSSIEIGSKRQKGRSREREGPSEVVLYMGPTKFGYPQAMIQEAGSFKQPAQPYMRPAFDAKAHEAIDIIAKEGWSEIEKTNRRRAARAARLAAKQGG